MCGTLESQSKKIYLKLRKKEAVGRSVYGLRQLLIIFGGVALVQLTMRN